MKPIKIDIREIRNEAIEQFLMNDSEGDLNSMILSEAAERAVNAIGMREFRANDWHSAECLPDFDSIEECGSSPTGYSIQLQNVRGIGESACWEIAREAEAMVAEMVKQGLLLKEKSA